MKKKKTQHDDVSQSVLGRDPSLEDREPHWLPPRSMRQKKNKIKTAKKNGDLPDDPLWGHDPPIGNYFFSTSSFDWFPATVSKMAAFAHRMA